VIPFSPALKAAVSRDATTLCHGWIVERKDGVKYGFTDHDQTIVIQGVACKPMTGLTAKEAERSLGLSIDATEIEGALSDDEINDAELRGGLFDSALVRIFLIDWSSPSDNAQTRVMRIAKTNEIDGVWRAELESGSADLSVVRGRLFVSGCDAQLADSRCSKNLNTSLYTASGTVSAVRSSVEIIVSGLGTFDDAWFALGALNWTSGANLGRSVVVLRHKKSVSEVSLTFEAAPNQPIAVGDVFSISAGCDKSFSTCKTKFANALNFRGFPHMPGNDHAYSYISEGMEFDGSPIVK
jgi:uncharacterized phage protein (TIGR02218 family)